MPEDEPSQVTNRAAARGAKEGSTVVPTVKETGLASSSTPAIHHLFSNPEGVCLFLNVVFLHNKRDAFQPKAEGFPVDEEDDFKGDERKCEGEASEVGGAQLGPLAGEGAHEGFLVALVAVDRNVEALPRVYEAEVKRDIERGEGGDIVVFRHSDVEAITRLVERDEVGLEFAESIADLNDGC